MDGDSLPPFPALQAFQAPPSWRCIDFISDLHLHAGLPRTADVFARYLRHTPADAVLILGDLFEAWVGDDMRTEAFEAECTAALAEAGQRLHLGFMVGNRDFLLGSSMIAACHGHALADPTVLDAWGRRVLLIHGDALCLADEAYLRFREQVRQPASQQALLSLPYPQRLVMARQMRQASASHHHKPDETWADVDEPAARAWMQAADANVLIHGHTHRPESAAFGTGMRHVLSDWDFDAQNRPPRGDVLRMTEHGFTRIAPTAP